MEPKKRELSISPVTIFTTAKLESDEEYRNDLYEGCGKLCEEACPVKAITKDGVDVKKCLRENMKYGLPGLIGFLNKLYLSNDDPEGFKEHLKDPTFWRIWQATTSGIFYDCFECMKACPIGVKK